MEDVYSEISFAIDDVITLINYCSIDKQTRNLCNTRFFWEKQFNKYNLPLKNDIKYTDTYSWIQLLLKTQNVMNKLNHVINNTTKNKLISAFMKVNISLSDILNVIKNEHNVFINTIESYFEEDYGSDDFIEALHNNYPVIINEIMITKYNNKYDLQLIINQNIENIPGGFDILQDFDDITFGFSVKNYQLENIMINLIEYL